MLPIDEEERLHEEIAEVIHDVEDVVMRVLVAVEMSVHTLGFLWAGDTVMASLLLFNWLDLWGWGDQWKRVFWRVGGWVTKGVYL